MDVIFEVERGSLLYNPSGYAGIVFSVDDIEKRCGIDELAEHMASHNTPFSKGAIKGLLTDMVSCVKEPVLQNKAVKIDNLAIFSIGIINKMGASSIKEWSLAKFVEGYRLRARATGKLSNTQLSLDANAKNAIL